MSGQKRVLDHDEAFVLGPSHLAKNVRIAWVLGMNVLSSLKGLELKKLCYVFT